MSNTKYLICGVLLVTAIFYLPGLLSPRDFWVEDEARYAEVLREMLHDGHYGVLHLNGHYYPDKPPVYFWLAALSSKILNGISVFSFMLITFISTIACTLSVFNLTRSLFDDKAAVWVVILFISNFMVVICAQIVRMDMLMAFFIVLSMHAFWIAFRDKNNSYMYAFYVSAALAVLTKGPLGIAIPLAGIICFSCWKKDFKLLFRSIFHWGLLIFLVIVGGWLVAAWFSGYQDFVKNLFIKQIAGRAIKAFSHEEPFYFYFMLLPLFLLPWTSFLPRTLYKVPAPMDDRIKFLLSWFCSGLILISFISGKLFVYLLPLIPPLVILMGFYFKTIYQDSPSHWYFRIEAIVAVILTFGVFGIVPFLAGYFPITKEMNLWIYAIIFVPLTVIGIVVGMFKKKWLFFGVLFLGTWLFSASSFLMVLPQADTLLSGRAIGHEITRLTEDGYQIAGYNVRRGILNFYSGRLIPEITKEEASEFLNQPDHLVIVPDDDLKRINISNGHTIQIKARYNVANQLYLIISLQ